MNEIDLVLQKFPSINREELLTLTNVLLGYLYNKCPKSLASLKAEVDKRCSDTMPIPNYYLMEYKEIVESEEFFNLLSKVEKYEHLSGSLFTTGLKVIGTDIKLSEYSDVIPERGDGPIIDNFFEM